MEEQTQQSQFDAWRAEMREIRALMEAQEARLVAESHALEERLNLRDADNRLQANERQRRGHRAGHLSNMATALLSRPGELLPPEELVATARRYAAALEKALESD